MSGNGEPFEPNLYPQDVEMRVEYVMGEAYWQSVVDHTGRPVNALGHDPYIASFAKALAVKFEDSQFYDTMRELFNDRAISQSHPEPFIPAADFNLVQKAYQRRIRAVNPEFPEGYEDPEAWISGIDFVMEDEERVSGFWADMTIRKVATNEEQRYAGPKLLLQSLQALGRLGQRLSLFDVGASQNRGLKQLALPEPAQHPFGHINILRREKGPFREYLYSEQKLTEKANCMLRQPLAVASALGIDVTSIDDDAEARAWAEDNRFRPAELSQNAINEYRRFNDETVQGVGHMVLDLLDKKINSDVPKAFNAAMFITMLHQLSEEDRVNIIEAAGSYVRPDGFIIIQDFASLDPDAPRGLKFEERWPPYSYNMFVIDMARREDGPQHLWGYSTGRATEMALVSTGSLVVNGVRRTAAELLRAA